MGSPAGNWFDQNAPAATAPPPSSGSGGDWFAQNSPGATATTDSQPHGFLGALWDSVSNISFPSAQNPYPGMGVEQKVEAAQASQERDQARKAAGYSTAYRALAPVAESVGADVQGMENAAKQGDTGAVLGKAAIVPATIAAAEGLRVTGAKAVQAVKNVMGVPEALSQDTASTLATVAHNEGLPPLTSTTAREATDELQQSFIKRAKDQYAVVDSAVNGDLKPVQERIQNLKKAIRAQANVNPDLADKYIEDLANQQKTLQGLIEKAKANGVPNAEQIMSAADKDYARGIAMKKVSAGVKTASGEVKMGGHPHPEKFASQIDRMNNTGVLQRALGPDGAQAMMDTAKQGLQKFKTSQVVKKVGLAGATAGVGAAGYHVAKSALDSQ